LMGVLEPKMTPEKINRAKSDASRWHAVSNPSRVKVSAPADNTLPRFRRRHRRAPRRATAEP
jgi:hypothetical protein